MRCSFGAQIRASSANVSKNPCLVAWSPCCASDRPSATELFLRRDKLCLRSAVHWRSPRLKNMGSKPKTSQMPRNEKSPPGSSAHKHACDSRNSRCLRNDSENANPSYVFTASTKTANNSAFSGSAGFVRWKLLKYWWEARISVSYGSSDVDIPSRDGQ